MERIICVRSRRVSVYCSWLLLHIFPSPQPRAVQFLVQGASPQGANGEEEAEPSGETEGLEMERRRPEEGRFEP